MALENISEIRRYIFSGSLTNQMADYLVKFHELGKIEPMDVLVSQLDRSGVNAMLDNIERGIVKSLFIDSGAYSIHSQGFEKVSKGRFATVDEFIDEYRNIHDSVFWNTLNIALDKNLTDDEKLQLQDREFQKLGKYYLFIVHRVVTTQYTHEYKSEYFWVKDEINTKLGKDINRIVYMK